MKIERLAAAALLLSTAVSVHAQKQFRETLEPSAGTSSAPMTIGQAIQRLHGAKASVIEFEGDDSSFIIPLAGNTPGNGGTYFRSDVVLSNSRSVAQRIGIGWLAQGVNNCSAPLQYFNLPANSVTALDDFVGTTLGKSGLGAVLVLAVLNDGSLDDNGTINGYSRIWTPQPGSTGTVSQNFAAISALDSIGSLPAMLMGLKQNTQFRTNVGVVNLDSAAHTWAFRSVFTQQVTNLSVSPCSVSQIGAAAGSGSSLGNVAFSVTTDASGAVWSGFGSSTDNVTGDGWVSRATQ